MTLHRANSFHVPNAPPREPSLGSGMFAHRARRLFRREEMAYYLAIDIGSSVAIRSLLFREEPTHRSFLRKDSFDLPRREREADLIPLIDESIRHLLFRYLRGIGRVPAGILIGLGNHFTLSEISVITRDRPKPQVAVHQAEFDALLEEFRRENRERLIGGAAYALAHVMPFRATVDGYPVADLTAATTGRGIEMTLFVTYALREYWTRLWQLRELWGGLSIRFASVQAAIAAAVVSRLHVGDAFIVKIGARQTDLILLSEGAIAFSGRLDRGGDHVTERIAERTGMPFAEAERLKRQWMTLKLPARLEAPVAEAVHGATEDWLARLSSLLKHDSQALLPERIYLVGGGARLPTLAETISRSPWFREFAIVDRLTVERLDAETCAATVFDNAATTVSGPEEVALAALAMHLSTVVAPGT